ncbi:MAG: amidohydrolase [Clostridia bacterium]|nr:amidohydrolase [Clostridia bacterium]
MTPFTMNESDLAALEYLKDFTPEHIFDSHIHIHTKASNPPAHPNTLCREAGTIEAVRADIKLLFPNTEKFDAMMIPMPDMAIVNDRSLRDKLNGQIISELDKHPDCVGEVFVCWDDDRDTIESMLTHPGIRGLKCYSHAPHFTDREACAIPDFLPEAMWEVANERKLAITLHMMRIDALADRENFDYIVEKTAKYPDAQLILAHCARAFASRTVVDAIGALPERDNIWYDTAVICEVPTIAACLKKTKAKRVLWGTDYPIGHMRGRPISLSTGFTWLIGEPAEAVGGPLGRPCYITLENMIAMKQAATLMDLDATQIRDVMCNNARRLFGLEN